MPVDHAFSHHLGAGTATALLALCLWAGGASAALAQPGPLGQFEGHGDVGSPALAGSATWNAASQEYRLSGAGVNMWGPRDEFRFVWKRLRGDFILRARVAFVGEGVDPHRKAGVIVRSSLDAGSPYADAVVHGDGLTSLQFRRGPGAETEESVSAVTGADVLQIERQGSTVTASVARFGALFQASRVTELDLGEDVYVGLFVCSHNPGVVEQAVFGNVRLVRPFPDGAERYRDFLGSRLEVLDLASGRRTVVHQSKDPYEAPNWTLDGAALIYNSSGSSPDRGRLKRFDLLTRQAALIDTGSAVQNNNDHVISFDGTMLGISSHTEGGSTIYTLPLGGGEPRRVTTLTPSYLHGWSPDGKWLVYTGGRNDQYDIYRIPSDGSGPEEQLTDHAGLDDGPEYSPDGRSIYFNSTRSGTMQIWRMGPDGRDPEQVTDDEYNNWFPHLSPDGSQIAFITFPREVDPSDHPYYQRVYLRLMPVEGGTPRVIAYLYGGQGTINVPSWSPDGTMLAFVSNTGME
jgi:sugar lactone lactonase YvrE